MALVIGVQTASHEGQSRSCLDSTDTWWIQNVDFDPWFLSTYIAKSLFWKKYFCTHLMMWYESDS